MNGRQSKKSELMQWILAIVMVGAGYGLWRLTAASSALAQDSAHMGGYGCAGSGGGD